MLLAETVLGIPQEALILIAVVGSVIAIGLIAVWYLRNPGKFG